MTMTMMGGEEEIECGMGWGVKLGGERNVELGDAGWEVIDPLCGWRGDETKQKKRD